MQDSAFYTSKLKIIDDTFNKKVPIQNENIKFQNHVYIYIYSNDIKSLPKISHVGDVIRIRRFSFVLNTKGELTGHMNSFSNWMTFGITADDFSLQTSMNILKNEERLVTNFEKEKISQLRNWAFSYFGNFSLKQVIWFTDLNEPNNESVAVKNRQEIKEIDLILMTEQVNVEEKSVELKDWRNKTYFLYLQSRPVLIKGQVIKLRSVDLVFSLEGRIILLSHKSSCLLIPEQFFDSKMFEKGFFGEHRGDVKPQSPGRRIYGSGTEKYLTRKSILEKYSFLEDYYYEEHLIGNQNLLNQIWANKISSPIASLVKKDFCNKFPQSLADFGIVNEANFRDVQFQKFVLRLKFEGVEQRSAEEAFSKYCTKCEKVRPFSEPQSQCCKQPLNVILVMKV